MGEHPNATKAREIYAAIGAGDFETMVEGIADDVVWHQIGGTTLRGKQEFLASEAALEALDFTLEVHDVVGNDEHVVGLVTTTVRSGGYSFTYRTAEIAHFNSEGQVTERWAFSDDTEAILEFFGSMEG